MRLRLATAMTVLVLVPLLATLVGVLAVSSFMFTAIFTTTLLVCLLVAVVTVPAAVLLGRGIARRSVWEHVLRLRESTGLTIFMTTHYMEEAERLCNRIAIMDEGKIIALGTLEQLLELRNQQQEIQRPHGLQELFIQLTGKTLRD